MLRPQRSKYILTATEFISDSTEPVRVENEVAPTTDSALVDFFRLCKLVVSVVGLPVLAFGIVSPLSAPGTLLLTSLIGGIAGYLVFLLSEHKN